MIPQLVPTDPASVAVFRRLLLAILLLGMIGTGADLLLLEHFEHAWQLPPLVLIAAGLAVAGWAAISESRAAVAALRVTMVLFVLAGALGVVLHFNGNTEYQREIDPTISGWPLLVKVMTAKAPPALAPAGMVQLGMLGLLYTYRHPAATRGRPGSHSKERN